MNQQSLQAIMQQLQAQAQPKKALVEFKAGMLKQTGTTVTADERRGKVSLIQGDDQLLHLVWKLRPQDTTELDLTVVPQGATVEKVPECTTGRVILLRFKNSTRRFFFWMQEVKDDQDDKLIKQMNDCIENPPRPGADGMGGAGMGGDELDQSALMAMFGGGAGAFPPSSFVTPPPRANPPPRVVPSPVPAVAPSPAAPRPAAPTSTATTSTATSAATPAAAAPASTTSATTTTTTATTTTTTTTTTTSSTATTATTTAATAAPAQAARPNTLAATLTAMAEQLAAQQHSLEHILEADRVLPNLEEKDIAALLEFLPEGQRTPHDLEQTLRSPQFQQTLQNVSQILNSRQFGALMTSLGLPTTGSMGVLPFCEAIQKQADDDKKKEGGDKK